MRRRSTESVPLFCAAVAQCVEYAVLAKKRVHIEIFGVRHQFVLKYPTRDPTYEQWIFGRSRTVEEERLADPPA